MGYRMYGTPQVGPAPPAGRYAFDSFATNPCHFAKSHTGDSSVRTSADAASFPRNTSRLNTISPLPIISGSRLKNNLTNRSKNPETTRTAGSTKTKQTKSRQGKQKGNRHHLMKPTSAAPEKTPPAQDSTERIQASRGK